MNIIIRLIVLTMLVSIFITGCGKEAPREIIRPVRAIKVGDPTKFTGRPFPGRAEAYAEVNLGFEVSGTILERLVDKGDKIKKNQLLARLDPRDFEDAIKVAIAEMERDKAYQDRIAKALETGAVAEQDLTDADARLDQAIAIVNIKKKALEDSHLYAPFDGVVAWKFKEAAQRVEENESVLRVLDIAKIKFTIDIPETLISRAPDMEDFIITFDAFPDREVHAKIKEIGTEASAATRTYPVTLVFDELEDIKILPGMAGMAQRADLIESDASDPAFKIPVSAIFTTDNKRSFVWAIDTSTMTAKKHEVNIGNLFEDGILARELKKGMWIATAGVHTLREGQEVKIMEARKR
jgi:RND family efflux transporter MFP subunit